MISPLAFLNGRFLPFAEAALPLHDAGFVSGATIVDNARTFRHKLFRWPDRETCYIPLEMSDEHLTAAAEELVAHNAKLLPPSGELQLVTFATPGPLGFYLGEEANGPPTLGMVSYPLPFTRYRRFFTEGVVLAAVGPHPSGPDSVVPARIKHRSRMTWHVADHKARERTGRAHALAILLGPTGALTETGVANFLAVIDDVVITPPRETALAGVSLRVTQELCAGLGLRFTEASITLADVHRISEAMLAGTGFCIAGVRSYSPLWNPSPKLFLWPGPVFRKLLAAWSDHVGVDIEKQFTG
jgi:branched-chain amino acid aminotransferase